MKNQHCTSPKEHHSHSEACFRAVFLQLKEELHLSARQQAKAYIEINKRMASPEEDQVLAWPSQSLNLTENLWGDLKRAVHRRCPRNLTDVELFILNIAKSRYHADTQKDGVV